MKSRWSKALLVALLCMTAPMAFADTVSMTLLNQNLVSWGGQYVSPYDARMTAPQNLDLQVICLDVGLSTYLNRSYVYDRTFDEGPSNFGAIQPATDAMYQAAARLGHQLLYTPGLTTADRGKLSFAIWSIFNSNWSNYLTISNKTTVVGEINALVTQALNQTWMPNFQVFTPLNGQGNYNYPSQRMMTVSVPEGSAAGMLGICLFGLFGLVLTLRRRAEQQ